MEPASTYPARDLEDDAATLRRRRWTEALLIVAFWTCSFMLTAGRTMLDPRGHGEAPGIDMARILDEAVEYGIWLLLTPPILWVARRFSLERGIWVRRLALHTAIAIAAAVVIDALGHFVLHFIQGGDRPVRLYVLGYSLRTFRFLDELIVYLVVLAAGFARDYFLRYQERLREATLLRAQTAELRASTVELQAQLSDARLRALRMQINPHFLFNTLHTISTYIERDPRGVRRMIARLSDLLRYTLEKTDANEVPLEQEMSFVDSYMELQRIRFQDTLEVSYDIASDVRSALVPNLVLQPLVENAIKHGVSARESGATIEVRAWRDGDWLHLSVLDNGPGIPTENGSHTTGIGLQNTKDRLRSLYGETYQFMLEEREEGGVDAHIILPYHTSDDLYTISVRDEDEE